RVEEGVVAGWRCQRHLRRLTCRRSGADDCGCSREWALYAAPGLLVAPEQGVAGGELLVDERDDVFQVLEVALVPAADMLDAAAPGLHIRIRLFVHNQP